VAFLAPDMVISPLSTAPPVIASFSISRSPA
jgi:hypothetical protein